MQVINRKLLPVLIKFSRQFPIIWIAGPRQSGKTTLAKMAFPEYRYVSLEDLDNRSFALNDPRGFLRQYPGKVIIDEVQKCPELLSYLQTHVDSVGEMGQFILAGSQQFTLAKGISQSLAGRVALITLLPLSLPELFEFDAPELDSVEFKTAESVRAAVIEDVLIKGMYPAIYSRTADFTMWYSSYYATYLERDIRELTAVHNLDLFDKFVRLCAARSGSLINYAEIANVSGIAMPTVKAWISLLRTSGIIELLQPYSGNLSKRLIKSPKLYFIDTGLLCYLLRITSVLQLVNHPLKGNIFETFMVSEFYKSFLFRGEIPPLYFWRDSKGVEVDIVIERAGKLFPVEIKSAETIAEKMTSSMRAWMMDTSNAEFRGMLLYGGDENRNTSPISARSWRVGV